MAQIGPPTSHTASAVRRAPRMPMPIRAPRGVTVFIPNRRKQSLTPPLCVLSLIKLLRRNLRNLCESSAGNCRRIAVQRLYGSMTWPFSGFACSGETLFYPAVTRRPGHIGWRQSPRSSRAKRAGRSRCSQTRHQRPASDRSHSSPCPSRASRSPQPTLPLGHSGSGESRRGRRR